jgi:hypothetical protein
MKIWLLTILSFSISAIQAQETRIKLYPSTAASWQPMYGVNIAFSLFPDKEIAQNLFQRAHCLNIEVRTTFGKFGEWSAKYQKYMGANLEFHYAYEYVRFFSYYGVIGVNNIESWSFYDYDTEPYYDYNTDDYIYPRRRENKFWNPSAVPSVGVGVELKSKEGNLMMRSSMGYPEILNFGMGVAF